MGEIQQGRYDRLLRRTTAQVGPGSKVGNALEDLFPMLEVESVPAELLRAVGWKLGAGQTTRTPAAGLFSAIQLFNPADSQHLFTLTRMIITVGTATTVQMGPSFTALTRASIAGQQRDTRETVLSETVGLIQDEDSGAVANLTSVFMQANTPFTLEDQNGIAVLAPGTGWRARTASIDVPLRIAFFWRERVAEPEELDF